MDLEQELVKAVFSATARASIEKLVRRLSKKDKPIDPALVQQRLSLHARTISSVKTLLSTDSHVAISEFYCAPSLRSGSRKFVPTASKDFRDDQILIEGGAGQGKSTLLRYLCSDSILNHGKVGLYYELRRLDHLKPLAKIVAETLQEFGLPGNSEAIKSLSAERDVEIYLDGFDELSQKDAEKVDRDIDYFVTHYPLVRIFVSARPHVLLSHSASLNAYRIEKLSQSDAFRLIDKLCREAGLSAGLKEKLRLHKGNASDLLETPLLVTLLVAKYSQTQQIPEQLSEFYASIFQTLFEKHDTFKIPFRRTKRLALSTHNYERIFEQFCFGSLFADALVTDKAVAIAGWAMTAKRITGDPTDFLRDIADVSSLIHEDHEDWSFIHNSVQEFYAADHLLSGTDDELHRNARALVEIKNAATRDQVFRFAKEIAEFRYLKFVELPFYEQLSYPLSAGASLSAIECRSWLKAHVREIVIDHNKVEGGHFFTIYTDCVDDAVIRLYSPAEHWERVRKAIDTNDASDAIDELSKVAIVDARMTSEASKRIRPILDKLQSCRDLVAGLESERNDNEALLGQLLADFN